jgi:uncharacterized protein (DUF433 family)
MDDAKPRGWYLAREVGFLAGVSGDTIGQWARYGYIRSSWSESIPRIYSFQDVAEAIAVHDLLDRGVPHAEIRAAITGLRATYGDWPLQVAPIGTPDPSQAGVRIAMSKDGQAWEVGRRRGQLLLSFVELIEINDLLRRGGWALKGADDIVHIEVDPDRLSGRPTIKDRRIPAEKVARLAAFPNGRQILVSEYDLRRPQIDDAVRWYQRVQDFERAA